MTRIIDHCQHRESGAPPPDAIFSPGTKESIDEKGTPRKWSHDRAEIAAGILALILLPYFVVRGWVTAGTTVVALYAAWRVAISGLWRELARNRPLCLMASALLAPLLATSLAQAMHSEFVPRYFDSPSRLALCTALLIYLHHHRVDWLRFAGFVVPASLYLGAALILPSWGEKHYWGDRAASQFMDPLMLAQQCGILGFMCLFLLGANDSRKVIAFKVGGFLMAIAMSIASGSRTGWTMLPVLALLWLHASGHMRTKWHWTFSLVALTAAISLLYTFSPTVHGRLGEVLTDISDYVTGRNRDTSIGIRLSLFRAAWAAFLAQPFVGWGFTMIPGAEHLPATKHLWTPAVQFYMVGAGTHNEWLQNMLRMGLLGLISRLMLYGIPLVLFAAAARTRNGNARRAAYIGLVVVIGYLTAGFTSEVSNLVYLSAFYGLMVAAFGAVALRKDKL